MDVLSEFNDPGMKNYFRFSDSNFMNLLINKLPQMHFKLKENLCIETKTAHRNIFYFHLFKQKWIHSEPSSLFSVQCTAQGYTISPMPSPF